MATHQRRSRSGKKRTERESASDPSGKDQSEKIKAAAADILVFCAFLALHKCATVVLTFFFPENMSGALEVAIGAVVGGGVTIGDKDDQGRQR